MHQSRPKNSSTYHDNIENKLYPIPRLVDSFLSEPNYGVTSRFHYEHCITRRLNITKNITKKLLLAVAFGKESRAVIDGRYTDRPKTAGLFAQDLLSKSPEFLLEKGNVTDWSGRTFKNITAFQYALWALDFKMIKKMLKYIPMTAEGDRIRSALLEQFIQMMAPINQGGGLAYTLIYDRPNVNAYGIPIKAGNIWQTTSVYDIRTESHFDLTPLVNAYEDYLNNVRYPFSNDRWIKGVGTQQKLLPMNIFQRYLDPDTAFDPLPTFTGDFKRSTDIYNPVGGETYGPIRGPYGGLFGGFRNLIANNPILLDLSSLSIDFAILRGNMSKAYGTDKMDKNVGLAADDLEAMRKIGEVSIEEMEKIKQHLTRLVHAESECSACVVQ